MTYTFCTSMIDLLHLEVEWIENYKNFRRLLLTTQFPSVMSIMRECSTVKFGEKMFIFSTVIQWFWSQLTVMLKNI